MNDMIIGSMIGVGATVYLFAVVYVLFSRPALSRGKTSQGNTSDKPVRKMKLIAIISISAAAGLLAVVYLGLSSPSENSLPLVDLKGSTFKRLALIRVNRRERLLAHLDELRNIATGAVDDKVLLDFNRRILENGGILSAEVEYALDKHFAYNYGLFYDILFIQPSGLITHSIRKESDYRANLFEGELSKTSLANALRAEDQSAFVSFEYYPPSDKPAAFFAVPILRDGKLDNWIVLQCSINTIDSILTGKRLGRTGEVYIVNKKQLMLTNSRFIEDSTILKLKVDTRAVREALERGRGERIVTDYRGIRVFSSFEKLDIWGSPWILLAEIDEDEVITDYYRNHKNYLAGPMLEHIAALPSIKHTPVRLKGKLVGMNEFVDAGTKMTLETRGVSTCTGLAVLYPGRFNYLAHLTPTDDTYIQAVQHQDLIGERKTDMLANMLGRIIHYDVYPYELRKVHFVIAANHTQSFRRAVDKILSRNVELASITFMHAPEAASANMYVEGGKSRVSVEWNSDNGEPSWMQYAFETPDLSEVLKQVIGYDT